MSNEKQLSEKGGGRGDLLLYWLLRAYRANQRQGWEEGPSADETFTRILDVLCNIDADPTIEGGTADHVLAQPEFYAPAEPRAAPPISLEEQAQPDAQDLTEEEIDRLEWAVRHAVQPSVSELVPRLLTEVKRRRGIK